MCSADPCDRSHTVFQLPVACVLLCDQSMSELKLASLPPTLSMQMHSTPNEPQTELRPQTGTRPEARAWTVSIEPGVESRRSSRILF